ncbi:hypothetical protein PROFUN_08297 [Planoprotostelium fungivorum]|uniref:Uncharacterized protein n=1 Tax=Planoprotostelium fungivorum TaxID=1890364 RepID=A0A2P6NJZ0_9EUKA|nr:hypothetical protein PROFUN_08297 [Planoprotostelium fungivorum]
MTYLCGDVTPAVKHRISVVRSVDTAAVTFLMSGIESIPTTQKNTHNMDRYRTHSPKRPSTNHQSRVVYSDRNNLSVEEPETPSMWSRIMSHTPPVLLSRKQ